MEMLIMDFHPRQTKKKKKKKKNDEDDEIDPPSK